MLANFQWYHDLITFLLFSGRVSINDLSNVVDVAAYYHGKGCTPYQASSLIQRDWPDFRPPDEDVEEPEDTNEYNDFDFLAANLWSRSGIYY